MIVHERWMREALVLAKTAADEGETPVGAVVVKDGECIARGRNQCEAAQNPLMHAEMIALRGAMEKLKAKRLAGCTLYVTMEPCPMCAGAILLARPDQVVFGAYDARAGCLGSVYRLTEDRALSMGMVKGHGGVLAEECAALLEAFFSKRRKDK